MADLTQASPKAAEARLAEQSGNDELVAQAEERAEALEARLAEAKKALVEIEAEAAMDTSSVVDSDRIARVRRIRKIALTALREKP